MTTWTPVGGTPVTWSVSPVEGILAATTISFTPAGVLSSTTVQDAITELATKSLLLANAAPVATSGSGTDIQTGNMGLGSLVITGGTLASAANALTVTGTLSSTSAVQTGVSISITGAGSDAANHSAATLNLVAGYTGAGLSSALNTTNASLGTGTTLIPAAGSNVQLLNNGTTSTANGAGSGYNVGVTGKASNSSTGNVGGLFLSQVAKNSATNIGVLGSALNTGTSPVQIGGFFGLNAAVGSESAALIADNGAQSDPVARFRVAGADRFNISGTGLPQLIGSSSGTITFQPQAAAGTYNWNLPTTAGASGDFLTSAAGGSSPMTWTTPAAGVTTFLATPTSANLAAALTDEIGSGKAIFSTAMPNFIEFHATGINFNSGNTDTSIAITLPSGYTKYLVQSVRLYGASGTLTTSTFGLFTAASAGGTAIVASGTANTISTATDGAANNAQSPVVISSGTASYTVAGFPTLFFRVQTPQGSAATGNVIIALIALP